MNKDQYIDFYNSIVLPIHFSPEWLDAVTPDSRWGVASVIRDGIVEGIWVYTINKKYGIPFIIMPPLTAYSGPWLFYPDNLKTHSRIAFEKRVTESLLGQLPQHRIFLQHFHPAFWNSLPLQWKGHDQKTRYTYMLDLTPEETVLWNNLKGSVRTDIKKATGTCVVTQSDDFDVFWQSLVLSFSLRNKPVPYDKNILNRLENALSRNARRTIFLAKDQKGTVLAGCYIVYQGETAHYLAGFYHPEHKHTAGMTVCLWEAIRTLKEKVKVFDFEGSVIPEIEKFFRAFGGNLVPHHKIYRIDNAFLRFLVQFKNPGFFE